MEYSDFYGVVGHLDPFAPVRYLMNPTQRIFIPYLLTSLVVAMLVFAWQVRNDHKNKDRSGEFASFAFPKKTYLHRSAVVDYFYFYINAVLYTVLLAPFVFLYSAASFRVNTLWTDSMGPNESPIIPDFWAPWVFTICIILALDLALYVSHYLQHRIPVLWQFHKVHHSAEVMTPVTVYRMHPVDDIFATSLTSIFAGIVDGTFRYFVVPQVTQVAVLNLNIVMFIFYVFAYHLRHSHIWLSYGNALNHIFISPAQHQIHHSKAAHHWDRNYGFIFAFWDWAFKSLYVPKEREQLEFGIGNDEERDFNSVWKLYYMPFVKAYRVLRGQPVQK